VVYSHRSIQARKYQTRVDYVDLSAFGVDVDYHNFDNNKAEAERIDELITRYTSHYGQLNTKLESLDAELK